MSLNLNEFVLLIVSASLFVVSGVAVLSRFLHLRAENRLVRARTACRSCGDVFVSEYSGSIYHCPTCDQPNLRRRNGKLG